MFKKLPLFLASLAACGLYAQTIVSTTPQNKNVVLEEFTGIGCVFCPDGHARAAAIKDANPDRVSLINIHVGPYANPGAGDPDFRTPWGTAIAGQSGVTGYPAGTVNRHVFANRGMSPGATAMGRDRWAVSANEILAMPSEVNIAAEATIDVSTSTLTVHVEAYYTGDSAEDTNLLNVALLQNNTKGPQTGGNQGRNYNHMHRLVDLLTGQWGEEITTTTTGSFVERTYTYVIPEDYRDIPTEFVDMEVVAFITETHQEILTGTTAPMSFTGLTMSNDAKLVSILPIEPVCATEIKPSFILQNMGNNPLTSVTIDYQVNGGDVQSYEWSGNIESLHSETVELPGIDINLQETNTLVITLEDDENNDNNSESITFEEAIEATGTITIEISTDNYPSEFSWDLKDVNGNIVESGNGYPRASRISERFHLDAGCYTFTAYDSYGDGGTRVEIKDHENLRVLRIGGNWGAKAQTNFSSNGVLTVENNVLEGIAVYPVPATDILTITNAEGASLEVYNVLGQSVMQKKELSINESLDVSALQQGTYIFKITKDGFTSTKKVVISN